MDICCLLSFLISGLIFLVLAVNFFKHYKKERTREVINYLSLIGVLYFIIAIFSFFWCFDLLKYSAEDFLLIYALVIVLQSLFLLMAVFLISRNHKLFYLLFFYLIIFLSFFTSVFNFLYLFLITSFLLSLLFFVNLTVRRDVYKKIGYYGIFYSSLALFLQFLLLFGVGDVFIFSIILNLVFLFFIIKFLKDLQKYPIIPVTYGKYKKKSYLITFLRYFIFILVLVNFIFIGTVTIHEFGHFGVSKFYDCDYQRIVFEENLPHTEILCRDLPNPTLVLLGGFFLPFIIALILFIVGGRFLKDMALLVAGFNFLISKRDFLDLGISENLILGSIIIGVLFLILGVVLLARSRTEESFYASL